MQLPSSRASVRLLRSKGRLSGTLLDAGRVLIQWDNRASLFWYSPCSKQKDQNVCPRVWHTKRQSSLFWPSHLSRRQHSLIPIQNPNVGWLFPFRGSQFPCLNTNGYSCLQIVVSIETVRVGWLTSKIVHRTNLGTTSYVVWWRLSMVWLSIRVPRCCCFYVTSSV